MKISFDDFEKSIPDKDSHIIEIFFIQKLYKAKYGEYWTDLPVDVNLHGSIRNIKNAEYYLNHFRSNWREGNDILRIVKRIINIKTETMNPEKGI